MRFRRAAILLLACILPFATGCGKPAPRPAPQPTGALGGSITFTGTLPNPNPAAMAQDPTCIKTRNYAPYHWEDHMLPRTLPPVFVWISSPVQSRSFGNLHFQQTPEQAVLTQYHCRFQPRIMGVMPGQPVDFTSNDPFDAHFLVTPRVPGNPRLNLALTHFKPGKLHSFPHPELLIPVTQPHRPWMHAYINVVSTPYFTVSGPRGHFRIRHLPPGTYTLSAIRPGFPVQSQSITIQANTVSQTSFTFAASTPQSAPAQK